MRKLTIPTLLVIAALAALTTLGGSAGAAPKTTVKLGDNFFSPSTKTVRRGTKVRFRWVGRNPHNVTKARGPGGRFASRTTRARGVNFAKKFKKAGTYSLVCTIHPGMAMTLRVRR
ncbi:MAG TPA: plastocyanin/azurin family copper-binding protein [Solirubrobacterales bacterium]